MGAGVALLAFSLLATARAARASAAVATIRADFVATVTHELKTPLATIRAVGETLVRRRVKTEEDLDRCAPARAGGAASHALVNNLLAYSRVTDVTEVYSFETCSSRKRSSPRPRRRFRRQLNAGEYARGRRGARRSAVRADRTAIVLALDNLIDNAIGIPEGQNGIRARSSAGTTIRFDVIDHGAGIPADDLPQVRRRFVRGRTARGPGNGLGLAIVNRIATDHGGSLEMTSELGHGTTATLIIPKAEAACGQES